MHQSVQRWLQSVKETLLGKSLKRSNRASRCTTKSKLAVESLEGRSMMAITAVITGNVIDLDTDANDDLQVTASGGNVTFSSLTGLVNGNAAVGGISSETFSLGDFDTIQINGSSPQTIFSAVEIQGSADFASESMSVTGDTVDITTGPLSVNGLTIHTQTISSPLTINQEIDSTGDVTLETLAADISVNAPINASGQVVVLNAATYGGQNRSISQSATGVITADSVEAQANLGIDLSTADNAVSTIAGASLVSGDFKFRSTQDLTIGTVATASGISTAAGDVSLAVGTGQVLTFNQAVTAGGAGKTLTLSADAFDLDPTMGLTADNVVLQTVGNSANLTFGGAGLTNSELDAVNATNLTVRAGGTLTVSGAIALGDNVAQLITVQAAGVNIANSLSANSSTGTLRFETDSLALNGAISQSVSAQAVEIVTNSDIVFSSNFSFGGMDFTSTELAAFDETTVTALRFITTDSITFADVATDFGNGSILQAGAAVALQAGTTVSQFNNGSVAAENLAIVAESVALAANSNSVQVLAGSASTGDFEFLNSGALTINTVDVGGRGVGAAGINVVTATKAIEVTTSGTLTINRAVRAPGNVTLTTTGATSDLIAQHNVSGGIASFTGTTTLDSGRHINLGTVTGYGDVQGQGLVLNAAGNLVINAATYAQSNGAAGLTVTVGGDVQILQSFGSGSILNSNGGAAAVSITTGVGGAFLLDQGSTGGVASNGGSITINADVTTLTSGAVSTTGTVTIKPVTASRTITLGTEVAGSTSLTDAELDLVSAGTLVIGSATAGTITATADITRATSTTVQLVSSGDIVQNSAGGSISTGGGTLLLTPGSTAKVQPNRITNDVTASSASFANGSDLAIAIDGTTVDTQYTQLTVAGTVDLTGVDLVLSGSYTPLFGNVFTIVSATSRTGTFNGLANNSEITFNGEKLRLNYSATEVTLTALGKAPTVDTVGPFSIIERSANGTTVGTVTATDPDANPTFAWSITAGNTGGAFAIANTGVITVADSSAIVYTTTPTFTLTVQVSDGIYSDTETITINLTNVAEYDFGDAPLTYGIAQHFEGSASGPLLGTRDFESASQPNVTATGDDLAGSDDDDGVTFSSTTLKRRTTTIVTMNATAPGIVDAWIDFDRSGTFDPTEKIASGVSVVAGNNTLLVDIPTGLTSGITYARFRISTAGSTLPTGLANDGEVEDYQLTIQALGGGSAQLMDDPDNPGPSNPDVLVINGKDNVNDSISVKSTAPGVVTVYTALGVSAGSFPLASFSKILIYGGSGNDSIVIDAAITKPSTIYGDAGNDTISGGSGNDWIDGGSGADVLTGNSGDDILIGGAGNDTLNGGAGFDRVIELPGAANITGSVIKVGSSSDTLSKVEQIEITGTTGVDNFVFNNLTTNVLIDGKGGADTVTYTGDGNFLLTDSLLTRTSGTLAATVSMTGITSATLIGGKQSNKFTVSDWTRTLTIKGGDGTDTIEDVGSNNYVLNATQLQRTGKPTITLNSIENAVLTSAVGMVDSKFTIDNWVGTATLTGGAGVDTLAVTDNASWMTLNDTTLSRASRGAIKFTGVEAAELTGGSGANTINASAYSGKLQIDGKGGNDTLTSGSGTAIVFGGDGNDTLTAGSGPAVLVGGNGSDTLKVSGTPVGGANAGHAILIGGAGADKLTGGTGQDLLIDSSTDFDLLAADLANLLLHWTGAGTYAARAALVATDLAGALNPDGVADTLSGGTAALDLFFANLTGSAAAKDKLLDLNQPAGETATNNN
ncbi:beta strand repeat-containing protein [Anatilimnocola floriformis]|uniref:beta strand repeat-containing protein n=1 Tax=Anatilimnocola floriformis TaxID=2948575 RepID=UPI0021BC87F1|nr:GEVED domain-containing protein [Anatilimnocola floriformis]